MCYYHQVIVLLRLMSIESSTSVQNIYNGLRRKYLSN
ncbi:unnamed protein product [Tenebrio molitor]|nr:unnamed protein product [Tenebrio molitor]